MSKIIIIGAGAMGSAFTIPCIENGNDVKISNFGTFSVKKKNSRLGRNPKTGDEKEITARNVISFYPSKTMKTKIS